VIHATNGWNPTGQNLTPVKGTRLYYVHTEALNGPRTYVFLGSQQHLTFVADLGDHLAPEGLRKRVLHEAGLYPHLIDLVPTAAPSDQADPASPADPPNPLDAPRRNSATNRNNL
jgi:hypothetical protein